MIKNSCKPFFEVIKKAGAGVNKQVNLSDTTPNIDVFFDNLQVTHVRGALLEESSYYPFGLVQQGISSKSAGKLENKKKFVGQEFDTEFDLNWYQFKWRNHDPQIGRFVQIDPLASEYVHNSTYAYAENRVIDGIDLEGLEWYRTVGNGLSDVWYNGVKPAMDWVNSNVNPVTPIAEMVLGKEYSPNGFVDSKPRAQSAVEAAVFLFPIGKAANVVEKAVTKEIISTAEKKAVTVTQNAIKDKAFEKVAAKGASEIEKGVFTVTKEGVVLPKGATIPKEFVENKFRSSDFGEMVNGKFKSKIRIDPPTPVNMKGPNTSHFHLDGGKEHIFDISKWPLQQ